MAQPAGRILFSFFFHALDCIGLYHIQMCRAAKPGAQQTKSLFLFFFLLFFSDPNPTLKLKTSKSVSCAGAENDVLYTQK